MPDPTLPPILWWSAQLADDRRFDDEFGPGVIVEMPDSGLYFAALDEGWSTLADLPGDAQRLVVNTDDEPSVPPKPDQSPVADLSRDDRTDRITTAIANTCECADITVTVREADGSEAPLRRLARCLDGAGLIDHEGI